MRAMIAESTRPYIGFTPTFEDRVDTAYKLGADHVTYLYLPVYYEMVGVSESMRQVLYGNVERWPVDKTLELRSSNPKVHECLVQTEKEASYHEWKEWCILNFHRTGITDVDTLMYHRALIASALFLGHKERYDFVVLCPFRLKYNAYVYQLLNLAGLPAYFAEPMTYDDCI